MLIWLKHHLFQNSYQNQPWFIDFDPFFVAPCQVLKATWGDSAHFAPGIGEEANLRVIHLLRIPGIGIEEFAPSHKN